MNPITNNIEPIAQNGGTMNARIAGNVTNSIITASVDGDPSQQFGELFGSDSGNLVLPRGVINAKVEGTINNSNNALTTDPNKAFFAQIVHRAHGPVIPSTGHLRPVQGTDRLPQRPDPAEGLVQDRSDPRRLPTRAKVEDRVGQDEKEMIAASRSPWNGRG